MLRVLGNNQQLEDVYRTPVIKGNEPVEPDEPGKCAEHHRWFAWFIWFSKIPPDL